MRSAGGLIRKIFVPEAQRRQATKRERTRVTGLGMRVFVVRMDNTDDMSLECASVSFSPFVTVLSVHVCVCTKMCCIGIFST